jgi:AbrB family looped-hinge helix DNA binding protein
MGLTVRFFLKSDGRITIPKEVRLKLGLKSGSVLEGKVYGDDKLLITVLSR